MQNFLKSFALAVVLTLMCLPPLHAQVPATAPAGPDSASTSPAPSAQAPDEVTRRITDLVDAGKYAEAQQLTTGLLAAYPGDPRLIKAKALLDKLLSSPGSVPGSSQPTSDAAPAQAAAAIHAEQLTGMDKVDYNALIELARQAQQSTDLGQQEALLQQFMDQSSVFLQKHPEQMLVWQLRAASAISLNDPMKGYDAGQKLLALGAADSNDQNLQRLLAQLKNKGWLDKQNVQALLATAEAERLKGEHDRYTFPVERSRGAFRWTQDGFGHLTINENDFVYEGSDSRVQLSKDEVREFKFYGPRFINMISIIPKDGKSIDLWFTTEDVVTKKINHPEGLPSNALEQAVAERWKYVWDRKHKSLTPPGAVPVAAH
jgi:hypothetical protein